MKLFHKIHEMGNTIVMITHDLNVAQEAERIVRIVDGKMYEDTNEQEEYLEINKNGT